MDGAAIDPAGRQPLGQVIDQPDVDVGGVGWRAIDGELVERNVGAPAEAEGAVPIFAGRGVLQPAQSGSTSFIACNSPSTRSTDWRH